MFEGSLARVVFAGGMCLTPTPILAPQVECEYVFPGTNADDAASSAMECWDDVTQEVHTCWRWIKSLMTNHFVALCAGEGLLQRKSQGCTISLRRANGFNPVGNRCAIEAHIYYHI